jgi:signal transduction histidine kinase
MRHLIPDSLFTRLFLLLLITLTASHFLGMAVMVNLHGHPPSLPRPPHDAWGRWLHLALRYGALGLTAWVGARWVSRPIKRMAQTAEQFGNSLDCAPMAETGPIEAKRAARALNRMQARLLEQIHERSRFLAAISHDLRTPLTRLKLRVEAVAEPELRDKLKEDIDEMSVMLAATLDFLRGQSQPEALQPLDVTALARSLAEDAEDQGQPVTVDGEAQPIPARPLALRRCLNNLVDNALRYGRRAEIRLKDSPKHLVIEVRDRGPGIPESQLEAVFAPFHRLDASRNRATGGIGLGLSIARDIALSHGGFLTLNNAEGGGLVARLVLPRGGH